MDVNVVGREEIGAGAVVVGAEDAVEEGLDGVEGGGDERRWWWGKG
jgi:hypothetical protein